MFVRLLIVLLLVGCFTEMEAGAQEREMTGGDALAEDDMTEEMQTNLQGNLMMIAKETVSRKEPKEEADAVEKLSEGNVVLVIGNEDGWYQIFYQEKIAYVPMDMVTDFTQLDSEMLDKEMKKVEEEGAAFVESLEMQRRAVSGSHIWNSIIVGVIALIFLIGILSSIKKTRKNES